MAGRPLWRSKGSQFRPPHPPHTLPPRPLPQYCDRGSLRDAVKGGTYHTRLPDGRMAVSVPAVIEALLGVANALQYLHGLRLVHGDVKVRCERGVCTGVCVCVSVCVCVCATV